MELRPGTFIFNPDNEHGERPAPARLTEALVWTSMGALLLGPPLAVPVLLALWVETPAGILALITSVVSLTVMLGIISARWAWAAWDAALDYRRHGTVLYGRLLRSDAAPASELDCPVTLDYTFTDPSGLDVYGSATRHRPDLAGCLPRRNTPVALLYVSPERHELL